ncbi:conserved hypothetical protein [Paecilomyces variotii No. 5]|uniref:F-box domain-containing protein n=1 Tax=Byssochlamys spectabilis (strain No. 5 / NBRC 109023) TaxID=1356009 RepID=V5I630_BYSSN|nr:conserved hypothetical protein [Paecilomyces variotii No. 5]
MSLLSLPVETLQEILGLCIPEGIDELSETCRTLYYAAQRFRPDHLLKRRQYTVFRCLSEEERRGDNEVIGGNDDNGDNGDNGDDGDDGDDSETSDNNTENYRFRISKIVELLVKIAEDPLIARYIQVADFRHDLPSEWDLFADEHRRLNKWRRFQYGKLLPHKTSIIKLLETCPSLQEAEVDAATFWEHMVDEDGKKFSPLYGALLLLSFLTNVRKLVLPTDFDSEWTSNEALFQEILGTIVKRAQTTAARLGGQDAALAKLRTLLPMTGSGENDMVSLQTLLPFMSIPSVVEVLGSSCIALAQRNGRHGRSCYMGYRPRFGPRRAWDLAFKSDYEVFATNLERLEMIASNVDFSEIRDVLDICPKLKVFKFDYVTKEHSYEEGWNAGYFMKAIEDTCSDTLEDIGIKLGRDIGYVGTGVVSMRLFRKLRWIELDVKVFLGIPLGGIVDQHWASSSDRPPYNPQVPKVTELLPASAEKLSLLAEDCDKHAKCLEALFAGVTRAEREEYLPNLQTVEVRVRTDSYLGQGSLADSVPDPEIRASASDIQDRFECASSAINIFGGLLRYVGHSENLNFISEIFDYI